MDISALNTTNDIEKLRAMALAMVQKLMSENAADKAEQERELQAKNQRIQLLEEMLKLVRQQRFGKKCETLAGMQRSLFEEDVDAVLTGNLSNAGIRAGSEFNYTKFEVVRVNFTGFFSQGLRFHT